MKKLLAILAAVGLVATASAAFADSIVGSKHDLSPSGKPLASGLTRGTSTQICVYCHTPHGAVVALPLWNRVNPTTVFTLYSGVNMANVSFKTGFTTDSTSLFCMSCHDGQTNMNAVDNLGRTIGNEGTTLTQGDLSGGTLGKSGNLGTNLANTHPINFPVTGNGQSDLFMGSGGGTGAYMGDNSTSNNNANIKFPLFRSSGSDGRNTTNRSLECGSCHSVHDPKNVPFLRDTMYKSYLCLGCHNK